MKKTFILSLVLLLWLSGCGEPAAPKTADGQAGARNGPLWERRRARTPRRA